MEVLRVQTTFTSSNVASPPDATAGFSYEGYIAIGDVRFSSFVDCATRHSSATWKITRKSQRHCVWTSMEHQCRRRYSANTMHSFEALFKVQLTEFVFKCNKAIPSHNARMYLYRGIQAAKTEEMMIPSFQEPYSTKEQ